MDSKNQVFEIEYCVNCGKETQYKKGDHIDTKISYIEGAGQLCSRCHYNQVFIKQSLH